MTILTNYRKKMKSSERNRPSVSFTLDKKLVLLVMIVTVIALGITSFMIFSNPVPATQKINKV